MEPKYMRSWKVMIILRMWSRISRKHEQLVYKVFLSLYLMVNMLFREHSQSKHLTKFWIKYGKRNKLINQYAEKYSELKIAINSGDMHKENRGIAPVFLKLER